MPPPSAPSAVAVHARVASGLALLSALVALLVYLPALDVPFVYDDHVNVLANPVISEPRPWLRLVLHDRFRPLVNVSYALEHALHGGLDPRGFHLGNLLLHALNAALLCLLATRLAGDRDPSAATSSRTLAVGGACGLLFALHPALSQAVVLVSARGELLCAGFVLAAWLALRRGLVASGGGAIAAGLVLLLAAATSKEVALALPPLLLLWDLLLPAAPRQRLRERVRRLHLPLLIVFGSLAAARLAVFLLVEAQAAPRDPWLNLLTQITVWWRYLGLLLLPVGQSLVHPVSVATGLAEPRVALALVGLALALGLLVAARRRAPLLSLGGAWFLLALLPSSSLIPLQELMAEQRLYLASGGVLLLLALAWSWLWSRRPLRALALLALVAAGLGLLTRQRIAIWQQPQRLWQEAAQRAPRVWVAWYGLAETQREAGDCEQALASYRQAIQLEPREPRAWGNMGACLLTLGRAADAEQLLTRGLEHAPHSARLYANLGLLAARAGRDREAVARYRHSLELDPGASEPRWALALLLERRLGRPRAALEQCRQLLARKPAEPRAAACVERLEGALAGEASP